MATAAVAALWLLPASALAAGGSSISAAQDQYGSQPALTSPSPPSLTTPSGPAAQAAPPAQTAPTRTTPAAPQAPLKPPKAPAPKTAAAAPAPAPTAPAPVQAAAPTLPFTGLSLLEFVLVGLGLVVLGALLRRRRVPDR